MDTGGSQPEASESRRASVADAQDSSQTASGKKQIVKKRTKTGCLSTYSILSRAASTFRSSRPNPVLRLLGLLTKEKHVGGDASSVMKANLGAVTASNQSDNATGTTSALFSRTLWAPFRQVIWGPSFFRLLQHMACLPIHTCPAQQETLPPLRKELFLSSPRGRR